MARQKSALGWLVAIAVVLAVVSVTGAGAPTVTTSEYAEYTAEVLISGGNLTMTPQGVSPIASNKNAVGDLPGSPVTMSSTGNPTGYTDLVKGNWAYNIEIQAITGTTPASATFKIDLKVNGTITDTLYVASDGTPATGELVDLSFDLGTATIGNEQSFVIQATQQ